MSLADSSYDILDIDEVLKDDSFCLSSENIQEDITSILQQWKQNDKFQYGTKGPTKLIDTRTFTRPKKRSVKNHEASGFSRMDNLTETSNTPINLQIGGLVTSMQKSFLNDTSPPSTMCSSIDMAGGNINDKMNASLITSSDFTNVNFLINSFDELNSQSNFNGYNLENVIKDREFLENLSFTDETFLKDACISKTDNYFEEAGSSGHSTLHNSEEFFINNGVLNETFVPAASDETYNREKNNTTIIYVNDTFIKENDNDDDEDVGVSETFITSPEINKTFSGMNCADETFPITPIQSKDCTILIENTTFDLILQTPEQILINNTINDNENVILRKPFENVTPIKNTTFNSKSFIIDDDRNENTTDDFKVILQSTPLNTPTLKKNHRNSLNLSPIITKQKTIESNILNSSNKMEEFEKYLNDVSKQFSLTPDDNDDIDEQETIKQLEEERRSLANFEEFEKSMSLLEDNKTEKEFDDILNSLGNNDNKIINEKMRLSIDSIKKRHYLINMEKQKVEQKQKINNDNNLENSIDSNKLSDSFGKSMNSSSGSERLLNRRSRMYDEISSSQEIDIKEEDEENINKKEQITESIEPHEKHNRDRFKTIRIFKRPEDNTFILPDAERTSVEGVTVDDRFNKKDVNSPQQSQLDNRNENGDIERVKQTEEPRRRALSKPRFFGRKENPLSQPIKSSSANDLDRNSENETQNKQSISKLKSPMGVKAKSIHNLLGNGKTGIRPISYSSQIPGQSNQLKTQSEVRPNTLARPSTANSNSSTNSHDPRRDSKIGQTRGRTSIMRPTSAYYNYNVKKNDCDETGRSSPISQSSLASSKVSLQQTENQAEKHKPSLMRPPTNRPPIGRSGLPRPSGIPRR